MSLTRRFFYAVLIEACVLSKTPIVCACFVVAWLIWISRICISSATTSDLNYEPLSDKINVGKYACLVMTSTMHRPIVFAVEFCVGMRIGNARTHRSL